MYIKLGDIVKVLGMNDAGQIEDWYGEVVGILDGYQYEVYYIEQHHDVWIFNENVDILDKESINTVSRTKHGDYVKAWRKFGFEWTRLDDEITLVKTHQEASTNSDESESLDSCDSWSTTDSDTNVSDLIDDSVQLVEHV